MLFGLRGFAQQWYADARAQCVRLPLRGEIDRAAEREDTRERVEETKHHELLAVAIGGLEGSVAQPSTRTRWRDELAVGTHEPGEEFVEVGDPERDSRWPSWSGAHAGKSGLSSLAGLSRVPPVSPLFALARLAGVSGSWHAKPWGEGQKQGEPCHVVDRSGVAEGARLNDVIGLASAERRRARARRAPAVLLVELLRGYYACAPVLYDRGLAASGAVRRAFRALDLDDTEVFEQIALLHEVAGVAIDLATWGRMPSLEQALLSAKMLEDLGYPDVSDGVLLLECETSELDIDLQLVQYIIRRGELERAYAGPVALGGAYDRRVVEVAAQCRMD